MTAPVEEGDGQKVIKAEEILFKIKNGEPVEYDEIIIEGDLNLADPDLKLDKDLDGRILINSQIMITKSVIKGCVYFNKCIFQEIDFENTIFCKSADFSGSVLREKTNFEKSHFKMDAFFNGTQFEKYAQFNHVKFCSEVSFERATFNSSSYFKNAMFRERANFIEAKFRGDIYFIEAKFENEANFHKTEFGKYISKETVSGWTEFEAAEFKMDANFSGSEFRGYTSFIKAKFNRNSDFQEAQFISNKEEKVWISFYEAKFSETANFLGIHFSKYVNFGRSKFSILELHWHDIKDFVDPSQGESPKNQTELASQEKDAFYLALVKNYKDLGWFKDADDCYYQYRTDSKNSKKMIRGKNLNWSKFMDYVAWFSCGYGVRPSYTIFMGIIIILIFGGIFELGNAIKSEPSILDKSGVNNSLSNIPKQDISFIDSAYFSFMAFLGKSPRNLFAYGNFGYVALAENIIGWLLMALFLVTLGRVMIR